MKKLILLLLVLLLCGCGTEELIIDNTDCDDNQGCEIPLQVDSVEEISLDLKDSYESLNGKTNSKGKVYRDVTIPENDIFKLIDFNKIESLSEFSNLFSGIVFLSDPKCPWCRSVITEAITVAKDLEIDNVYVIHAWDNDGNEVFRDKYEWKEKTLVYNEGHPLYSKLINLPGSEVFPEYKIDNITDDEKIVLGEKRLFLPSFIYIKNGEVKAFTSGLSDLQEDAYEELTDDMIKDMNTKLIQFFKATKE